MSSLLKKYYVETFGTAHGMPEYDEWTSAVYMEMANSAGYAAWLQARAINSFSEKLTELAACFVDAGKELERVDWEALEKDRKDTLSADPDTPAHWGERVPYVPPTAANGGVEKMFPSEYLGDGKAKTGDVVWDIQHSIDPNILHSAVIIPPYSPEIDDFGDMKPRKSGNAKEVELPDTEVNILFMDTDVKE